MKYAAVKRYQFTQENIYDKVVNEKKHDSNAMFLGLCMERLKGSAQKY